MNKFLHLSLKILVLFATTVGVASADLTPRTLDDFFHAALKRSETVANQDEAVFQANENHTQAIGAILPNITGTGTYYHQSNQSTQFQNAATTQSKLTATQPIFVGGAFVALKETELTVQSQQQAAKQSRITLFQSVITAFYQVLAAERDIADLQTESKMYTEWVKFLQGWVSIGRARPSDVTQIQAQLYALYATLETSETTLVQARQNLAFLSGLPTDTPLQDPFPEQFAPDVESLDSFTGKIESRPDVKTSVFARDSADYGVDVAKSAHLPTVNALADYYLTNSGTNTTQKSGSWDVQLTLSLPIYSGGVTQSKVRQAASLYRQGELNLSQSVRMADQQVRTYFDQVRLDHEQVKTLAKARDFAKLNYEQETHDYRLGLVTNIDVLTSLTTFEAAERSFDKERFQERTDYLFLQSIAGKVKDNSISF